MKFLYVWLSLIVLVGGCSDNSAIDPTVSMVVTIPAGTRLCSGFAEDRTWQDELALVGRIDLAETSLVLDRIADQRQVPQFVQAVLHSPARDQYTPSGSKLAQVAEDVGLGWRYTFTTDLAGASAAQLDVVIELFKEQGGYPASASVDQIGSSEFVINIYAELRLGTGASEVKQRYGLCNLPGPPDVTVVAATTSGDQLSFELRRGPWFASCFAAGETACLFVENVELKIDGATRSITDPFHVIYAGNHHNWNDKYFFVLDPPIGNVHGLLATEPSVPAGDPAFEYLDATVNVIKTETPTWQTQ